MQLPSTLVLLFALGGVLIAARLFRRWKRLRHIKGPFLASVSELWILRTTFRGDMWQKFGSVCNEYGPVARVGPNEVVTADLDSLRRILGVRSLYIKSDWYTVFRIDPTRDQITTQRDDKLHGEIRAKMRAGYSGKENLYLEGTIDNHVLELVELIKTKYLSTSAAFQQLDFARVAQFFTLDVITDLAFGRPFGFLTQDNDVHDWMATIDAVFPVMNFLTVFPWLHLLLRPEFMKKYILPSEENRKGFMKMKEIIKGVVDERYGPNKIERQDMLGSFVRHGVTQDEAPTEAFLQVVAGSDTTATAIRMTFLHLITSPIAYFKLRDEIRAAAQANRISSPMQGSESHRLPYLEACIKEGLRIWTPVPLAMFKLTPPGGDSIAGIHVPGGTKVGINWWGISRNKEVYGDDVDVYRPERWLEASEKLEIMEKTNAMIFSPGKWECLGKSIALLELNKIFVELFRQFDFQIVNPSSPLKTFNAGLHLQSEMWVRVTDCNELIE